jgi:phosphate starvation-inducible protein PhoH
VAEESDEHRQGESRRERARTFFVQLADCNAGLEPTLKKEPEELQPKTSNQEEYIAALKTSVPYIIAAGSAGTGKTALACQAAANALNAKQFKRVLITRPAVNADEEIGFLPGSLEEKMMPYVKPLLGPLARVLTIDDDSAENDR